MSHDPSIYRPRTPAKIDTEYAPDGWCDEYRLLHSYHSALDWIIPHLQAMGEGLDNPRIELRAEGLRDDPDCVLYVVGRRRLRDEEVERARQREQAKRDRELAELAALKAKYEPS